MLLAGARLDSTITAWDGDDDKQRAMAGMCAEYGVWCYGSWYRVSHLGGRRQKFWGHSGAEVAQLSPHLVSYWLTRVVLTHVAAAWKKSPTPTKVTYLLSRRDQVKSIDVPCSVPSRLFGDHLLSS